MQLTNWPDESGEYKILQMVVDGMPCIRFEGSDDYSHIGIVKTLAKYMKRDYPFKEKDGLKIPDAKSAWYEIVGGGKSEVDLPKKEIILGGESLTYRGGIDKKHVISMRDLHADWKFLDEFGYF